MSQKSTVIILRNIYQGKNINIVSTVSCTIQKDNHHLLKQNIEIRQLSDTKIQRAGDNISPGQTAITNLLKLNEDILIKESKDSKF